MRTKQLFLILALLCAVVQGAWAQANLEEVYAMTGTTSANWTALTEGSTSGKTIGTQGNTTYYYTTNDLSFTNNMAGGSGLTILGTVYLYVPQGVTVTCTGANADGTTGAGAGIELAMDQALFLLGKGTVKATGGNAANGGNGANGKDASYSSDEGAAWVGGGGTGGNGGGGAGAGIGTRGGTGGAGGSAPESEIYYQTWVENGVAGSAGGAGLTADAMGNLYVSNGFTVNVTGGSKGGAGSAGSAGKSYLYVGQYVYSFPGGGGGGAGGFGGAASKIGSGGPGGGGGGGGAKGSHTWASYGFFQVYAKGGDGGQNADGSFAADGGTAAVTKANVENGLCSTNKAEWVKTASERTGGDVTTTINGGSGSTAGSASLALWPFSGEGTVDSPYLISSEYDWNTFAHNVSNGNSYSGQYLQLAADISVTTMAGNSFSGTFDGGDHTITANISGTGSMALFNCLDGGTIQNLRLAGNVSGGIHTAALLVSLGNSGPNLIQNCVVSANVTSSGSHMGGFLAHGNESNITINCCVFSGKMTGGSSAKGVFYGWGDASGTSRVTNCLYLMADGQDLTGLDLVHLNGATTLVDRCYKNTATGSYGTQATVSTEAPGCSGNLMYDCSIVKAYQGAILYGGNYYYDNHALYNHGGIDPYNLFYNFVSGDPNTRTVFTVYSDITWSNRMIIENDVVIYLAEGATLHAQKGIQVSTLNHGFSMNSNLTIDGPGTLIIDGCDDGKSGIGAQSLGSITINGGTINVKGGGGGAGIGNDAEPVSGGTITINGGIINATGGTYDWTPNGIHFYRGGAGIGGGAFSTTQGINVTINGGVVNARGGFYASGIGGGAGNDGTDQGKCGTITINGGQVTAIGGKDAPGIGPGNGHQASGTLTLSWTNQYEDFVSSSQFRDLQSISFATGKQFLIDGTSTIATSDNIGGQGIRLVPYVTEPVTLTGAGTAENPWRITCTEDWNKLVYNVNAGNSYSGQYVQLDVDIDITRGMGVYNENPDSAHPFSGTFLGDGHTITVTLTDDGKQGLAPFRSIDGATIKYLTVDGTITGGMHAAAIVGFAQGTGNSIRNCVATANVSGGTHIGGILGHGTTSDIAISGCVFSGTMTGGGTAKGAIVGWGDNGGTKSVTDCLYLMANGQNTLGLDLVRMNEGTVSVENSYKTTSAGSYGTQCICTNDTPSSLGTLKQDYGMVKAYATGILYDGTYYMAPATLTGSGTEGDPYLISNTYEWDSFVRYVNSGTTYSGQYVQLAEDISVSTMVGTSEANSFQGTFLGDGTHALTFTKGSSSAAFGEENCAPFRYIKNATIRDLKVMGDIYTSQKFAGGLVACCIGTMNIIGCQVGTLIYSSVSGDGTHGGIVAMPQSGCTLNIEGCVYDGHLLTNSDTNSCGGFVGWHNGATISVSNSLYAPGSSIPTGWTAINVYTTFTFVRGGNPTITNCYFTRALGAEQGRQCFPAAVEPTALGNLVKEYGMLTTYQNGVFYAGIYYMVPVSITLADNADNSTTISEAHGYVADVTLDGRTFYRDGAWNTLCLPFDATKTGLLAKAVIKELDTETAYDGHKTGFEDGTLYLNFKDAESIVAGKPYIVKWNAVSQEHIINPSDEVIAALDFITEVPTVDGGQATNWESTEGPEKLVDGNTATKYGLGNANPWVEFHYNKPITPKGYALMTAEDTETYGSRNPKSWTIKAKNSGDADWTTLATVDNTNKDKLPAANNQWTVFGLDNSTAYQYFRFEAAKNSEFQLAELRFCTLQPGSTEIVNPTFEGVNLNADAPTAVTSEDGKVSFTGYYDPVSIDGEDRSVLYLSDNNTLYYPNAAMTIGAFRAHFQLKQGLTAGEPTSPVRAFVLNFGDGERNDINASGIITTNFTNSTNSDNAWYSLDGRKFSDKPTQRGIYVNNGRKIIIK